MATEKNKNLHDKQVVEVLIKRLNDLIIKDSHMAKKAALIIETWLQKTRK